MQCYVETSWTPSTARFVYQCFFFFRVDKMLPAISGSSHYECPCFRSADDKETEVMGSGIALTSLSLPLAAMSPDLRLSVFTRAALLCSHATLVSSPANVCCCVKLQSSTSSNAVPHNTQWRECRLHSPLPSSGTATDWRGQLLASLAPARGSSRQPHPPTRRKDCPKFSMLSEQ
jgi:hypothetical protein